MVNIVSSRGELEAVGKFVPGGKLVRYAHGISSDKSHIFELAEKLENLGFVVVVLRYKPSFARMEGGGYLYELFRSLRRSPKRVGEYGAKKRKPARKLTTKKRKSVRK